MDDAKISMNMYGKEIAKLKCSKPRIKYSRIEDMVVIVLPKTLVDTYNTELISMDYVYV